jgi:RNA polymerase-binding transcription factor DksA
MAKKKVTRNKAGATSRRPTAKKTTRKPPARKTTKKKVAKPAAKRTTTKKTAKKTTKQTARKVAPKKTAAKAAAGKTSKKPPAPAGRKTAKKVSSRPKSLSRNKTPATPDADGYVIINGRRIRMISTPPQQPPPVKKRKTRNRAAAEQPVESKSTQSVKTKLGKKNLDNFRNLLLLARAELVGDLSAMEAQALRSGGGNLSHMPIHMADIGTDTYDQDFLLGLAETERTRLREIDAALQRIDDRTYGICQMTNRAIPKARLNAKPWARYTIEAALEVEQGNAE